MLQILLRSMRKYPWLRMLMLALICSSVGSGLTFIMVFGELARLAAAPSSFALAFMLSTSPGFLGSIAGKYLLKRIEAKYCFIIAECLGALGLMIPWYGLAHDSVAILQLAGIASSLAAGITIPAINHFTKHKLDPADIGTGAVIDTLVFACQVLFGIGIGVFLYGVIHSHTYLLVNLVSYIIAILFILVLPKLSGKHPQQVYAQDLPDRLSSEQRASLYVLPALAICGAPAMSLLPTLVHSHHDQQETMLFLLFSRSLGQLLGPFLVKEERYKHQSSRFIIACLAAFISCYLLVPLTPFLFVSVLLVFSAHLFSNIVYSLGWYNLLTTFDKHQVAAASASSYRRQIVIGAVMSILAGLLADRLGSPAALVICSIFGLCLSSLLILYVRKRV